jgi:hypothetical protein
LGFSLGCVCRRCASFKPFLLPALSQSALEAIFLQALHRFRSAMLFRGLRTSSDLGFPFWRLGLTSHSSRFAFGERLSFLVREGKNNEPEYFYG